MAGDAEVWGKREVGRGGKELLKREPIVYESVQGGKRFVSGESA